MLYEVVRYNPKDFRQRRPDPTKVGAWVWNMNGVLRVLYRLPEVLEAKARKTQVIIAEGEKDCDRMVQEGFTATCNVGGAAKNATDKKWLDSYTETLRGCDCVIIADKDHAGRIHAQQVASKPKPNAVKFFSTIETICRLADSEWLEEATKTIMPHWRRKNAQPNGVTVAVNRLGRKTEAT